MTWRRGCWRSWPSRPAIRPTCSTWTSISRPTWASTPSSRPRCSPPIRERYGIERDDTLKLRDYPTLNHVVGFVRRAHARGAAPTAAAAPAPRRAGARGGRRRAGRARTVTSTARVLAIVAEQTGYPRSAGPGSRPGGRPGDRHGQAGRGVRRDPRALRDRARRRAEAARLPDAQPRRRRSSATRTGRDGRRRPRPRPAEPRRRSRRPQPAAAAGEPAAPRPMDVDGAGAGDRGRADGLPDRDARPGSRPGGRPRDRHGQAGRGVRRDPRALRDRARRHAQAARLPDAQPRRRRSSTSARRRRTGRASGRGRSAEPAADARAVERTDGFPRRVPVPVAAARRSTSCVPTGVELGEGSRVVVMPRPRRRRQGAGRAAARSSASRC